MIKVFDKGPWHFTQRPLILKIWEVGINLSREVYSSMPIWVKIFNIPLEEWNEKGIVVVVASALSPHIHMDSTMEDRNRVDFARICVQIDASYGFPRH